jgi:putative holliday junction resolvase
VRAVGVDLGDARIGIALSDSGGAVATPWTKVERCGDERQDHRRIADLVAEVEADCVVVGLPLSLDGSIGPAAEKALAEVERLAAVLSVPVETYDERFTTVTAERVLREQGVTGRRRRQVIDQVAASVLLQAWLDARSAVAPEDDDGHP